MLAPPLPAPPPLPGAPRDGPPPRPAAPPEEPPPVPTAPPVPPESIALPPEPSGLGVSESLLVQAKETKLTAISTVRFKGASLLRATGARRFSVPSSLVNQHEEDARIGS